MLLLLLHCGDNKNSAPTPCPCILWSHYFPKNLSQTGFYMKPHWRQNNDPLRCLLKCKSNNLRPDFIGWTDAKKKAFSREEALSVACIMDQQTHTHKCCCICSLGPGCSRTLKGLRHLLIKNRGSHVLITDSGKGKPPRAKLELSVPDCDVILIQRKNRLLFSGQYT